MPRSWSTPRVLPGRRSLARLGGAHRGYYAKGHYYTLSGKSPFSHLVYPVAEAGGLGVHVTLDLGGQARFGPDVVWQEDEDYGFDRRRLRTLRRRDPPLLPRPRRVAPARGVHGHPSQTRRLPERPGIGLRDRWAGCDNGVPGLVNLLGIESPGLTASLAIAERVAKLVG